jgi:K+-sensing histidine kinase KdpD
MQFPFAMVFLAVLVTAWCGFRPALTSVVLGALASNYFRLPPRWSFELTSLDQQIGILMQMGFRR